MPEGTLVLLYHRVAHLDHDPYGFAVHPDRFAEQCDVLRRRGDVVPLRDANGTRSQVAITFDDGYADNCREACDILAAAGLPATFFITAGRLGQRSEVWWDRLEQIVTRCEPAGGYIDVEFDGRRLWADIRSSAAPRASTLRALLAPATVASRRHRVDPGAARGSAGRADC
jgi:peptidoglycan/xylan/chitin deacetylase (PgdA/CDA1 family)